MAHSTLKVAAQEAGAYSAFVTSGKMFKQKYERDQRYRTASDGLSTSWLSGLPDPGVADSRASERPSPQSCGTSFMVEGGKSWAVQGYTS